MVEGWLLYSQYGLILILLYYLVKGFLRRIKLKTFYRTLKKARPVSQKCKEGDFVHFKGKLAMPEMKTPYSQNSCSYWGIIVRAVFQTKAKKPAKGMTTHRPVIYKSESDQLPLMVSAKPNTIQIAIDKPLRFMVNMQTKESTSSELNIAEAQAVDKPKYTSYEYSEYWLPKNAVLNVWGVVSAINDSCISVSSSDKPKIPTLIYQGSLKEVFKKFKFRMLILLLFIVYCPFTIYLLLNAISSMKSELGLIVLDLIAMTIGIVLYRVGKIDFVN